MLKDIMFQKTDTVLHNLVIESYINCQKAGINTNWELAQRNFPMTKSQGHGQRHIEKIAYWADEFSTDAFGEMLAIICKCKSSPKNKSNSELKKCSPPRQLSGTTNKISIQTFQTCMWHSITVLCRHRQKLTQQNFTCCDRRHIGKDALH